MTEPTAQLVLTAAAGLWLALFLGRWLVGWLRLMRFRFRQGNLQQAERDAMPADVKAILDGVRQKLAGLGFEYENTVIVTPQFRGADQPRWMDVFVHRPSASRACASLAESPEPGLAAAVSFVSYFDDGEVITENRRAHLLLPTPVNCRIEDAFAATLAEQWTQHQNRIRYASQPALSGWGEVYARQQSMLVAEFAHWQQVGLICRAGDDYRFTAKGAWRYLRQVTAGLRRLATLAPAAEAEDLELRVRADTRAWHVQEALAHAHAMSRQGKMRWFAASTVVGAAALAYMTSWSMVPIVLGVLLFHEFGHALAMRALGYRNLSVLVLPFLGAVAIGRKDDAGPWQKLGVLLAGPLPGMLVAVLLLRLGMAGGEQRELLLKAGAMALVINLFNLLPFTPLDGGQIVETFLFSHRPRFRFAFFVASAIALMAVGLATHSTVAVAIGLLLLAAIPATWRRLRLLIGLGAVAQGDDAAAMIFRRLHEAPGPRRPPFARRLQAVRALLPTLRGRAPGLGESAVGVAIYLGAIALPVALLWDTNMPQTMFSRIAWPSAEGTAAASRIEWKAELAGAATPEARWQVLWEAGQWFAENEDDEQAAARYCEALAEAEKLPPGGPRDLHVLDARLALAALAEPAERAASYMALLPQLRGLAPKERWRLAEALEAVDMEKPGAPPALRAARLKEAISVRETADSPQSFKLLNDRVELARIEDTAGDSAAAEALLRKNLEVLAARHHLSAGPQLDAAAWFFIAHGRAAEAESILSAEPASANGAEAMMQPTRAWVRLARGQAAMARQALAEQLGQVGRANWQNWQRLSLLLDLAYANADLPGEQARWLSQAAELKATMGTNFRGYCNDVCREASENRWEKRRGQARLEMIARIGKADETVNCQTCRAEN
jgi:Zn-dependent protease